MLIRLFARSNIRRWFTVCVPAFPDADGWAGSMTRGRVTPLAAGAGITITCLGLGYLGDVVMGWHWLTDASILLAFALR